MKVYMTEEEQVEQIKKYWRLYGNYILSIILILILGFSGNRWYQERQETLATNASNAFNGLMDSASKSDIVGMEAKANYIKTTYPDSIYATSSALVLAKESVESKKYDAAISQLNWVIDNSASHSFKQVAKLRLARIYLYQNQYALALASLNTIEDPLFNSMLHEIKGDVYLAKGEKLQATKLYKLAFSELPSPDSASKELLMKLNSTSV